MARRFISLLEIFFSPPASAMMRRSCEGCVRATERRLVKNMVAEGLPWSQIQRITGRSPDTIRSILKADSSASCEGGHDDDANNCILTPINGILTDIQANLVLNSQIGHESARRLGFTQCPLSARSVSAQCPLAFSTVPASFLISKSKRFVLFSRKTKRSGHCGKC